MAEYEAQIAKVESAFLGFEDHGIFTASLYFDLGGSGQGTPQPCLCVPPDTRGGDRHGSAVGLEFIMRLLNACGVNEWKRLVGRTVYVLRETGDNYGFIKGIRPLPTEPGKEFIFSHLFEPDSNAKGAEA